MQGVLSFGSPKLCKQTPQVPFSRKLTFADSSDSTLSLPKGNWFLDCSLFVVRYSLEYFQAAFLGCGVDIVFENRLLYTSDCYCLSRWRVSCAMPARSPWSIYWCGIQLSFLSVASAPVCDLSYAPLQIAIALEVSNTYPEMLSISPMFPKTDEQ